MTEEETWELLKAQEELERRKRLHEAEQGLSKRQIVALVAMHSFMTETPDNFMKRNGSVDGDKLLDGAFVIADAFLRR